MCGVVGVLRPGGAADPRALAAPLTALGHRGPDDRHVEAEGEVALGVRRLAIVDQPGGRQPLRSGPVLVALNGEIYNHRALRRELRARGVALRTESDTEVVAALVAEAGVERALARLEGMFAFAAWHAEHRRLWLVRDRLGQKPLYWTRSASGELRFASELKGLLCWPDQPREPDPVAIEQLLLFEYVPAPRSVYRGVHKLEAGCLLEVDGAHEQTRRWWTPPVPGLGRNTLAEERWRASVMGSLGMAVRKRIDTDLPVALLLSGGLDSSAVALLAREQGLASPDSFSLGFDEPSFDESGPARRVAEALGLRHTALTFRAPELPDALDALTAGVCEPLADGSLPSTWRVCRAVHDAGYKLLLSGDGADEHLGGYPTYLAHRAAGPLATAGPLARRLAARLPEGTGNLTRGYRARRFAAGLGLPLPRRNQVWLGAFLPDELDRLLPRRWPEAWDEVDRWGALARSADPASAAMFLDQRLYLGEGVLAKADRASMLSSVELRSPFLDHLLVELVAPIPVDIKLRHGQTKALLRRGLAGRLPEDILQRPKKGFGTPLGAWLAGPCSGLLDDLERPLAGVVDGGEVRRLVAEHRSGQRDHRRRLWTLLVLSRWWTGPWGPSASRG